MKHYDLAFGTKFEIGFSKIVNDHHIYANFETDRIFAMGRWGYYDFHKISYWGVRKIALSTEEISHGVC